MQETQFRPLVQEDATCCRETEPEHHSYGAMLLSLEPQLLKPVHPEPLLCNKRTTAMRSLPAGMESSLCSLQLEKRPHGSETQHSQEKNYLRGMRGPEIEN